MKIVFSLFFTFLTVACVLAQQTPNTGNPPELLVLSHRIYMPVAEKGAGDDPYAAIQAQNQAMSDLLDANHNTYSKSSGISGNVNVASPIYLYEIKVKNSSLKTITQVAWDYIFVHPDTQRPIWQYSFVTYSKIKPGKDAKLAARTMSQPIKTISNNNQWNKKSGKKTTTKIVLNRVWYSDGTIWQKTGN